VVKKRGEHTSKELEAIAETVRWMMLPSGRPGIAAELVEIVGVDSEGNPASLKPAGEAWVLQAGGKELRLRGEEAVKVMGEGGFKPEEAAVKRGLAKWLFQVAVTAAEQSVIALTNAARRWSEGPDLDWEGETEEWESEEEQEVATWLLSSFDLDKVLQQAPVATVAAVAAAEAQVNEWADLRGGWLVGEDELALNEKCKLLARKEGGSLNFADKGWSWLCEAIDERHAIVHNKPGQPLRVPLAGKGAPLPGRNDSLRARKSCFGVRATLVGLARVLGEDPPRYLAMCPPGSPEDDGEWLGAVIRTGMRDDPDFPKTVDWLRKEKEKPSESPSGGSPVPDDPREDRPPWGLPGPGPGAGDPAG
jgi:hypothetical protein